MGTQLFYRSCVIVLLFAFFYVCGMAHTMEAPGNWILHNIIDALDTTRFAQNPLPFTFALSAASLLVIRTTWALRITATAGTFAYLVMFDDIVKIVGFVGFMSSATYFASVRPPPIRRLVNESTGKRSALWAHTFWDIAFAAGCGLAAFTSVVESLMQWHLVALASAIIVLFAFEPTAYGKRPVLFVAMKEARVYGWEQLEAIAGSVQRGARTLRDLTVFGVQFIGALTRYCAAQAWIMIKQGYALLVRFKEWHDKVNQEHAHLRSR